MKKFIVLGLAVLLGSVGSLIAAEQIKSGPQTGDSLGAFYVTKCAGAEKDGVKKGKNLCYRCRNGVRPQVIVFTRSMDTMVVDLMQKLDKAVAKHAESQLRVFVNLLGEDKDELSAAAKKLATHSNTSNLPIVVPNEFENGPDNYGISPKAAVTVILASGLGVKANHAVAQSKDLKPDAVVADLGKILE